MGGEVFQIQLRKGYSTGDLNVGIEVAEIGGRVGT